MLGVVSLVVDLGHGRQTKRRVQNSVDAAGLAGAALYDGSTASLTSVRAKAITVLGVNSFPSLTATGDPNVYGCGNGESCTIKFSYSPAPVASPPAPSLTTRYCVKVELSHLRVNTLLAPVIGVDKLFVTALANGCRRHIGTTTLGAVSGTGGTCTQPEKSFITRGNGNLFDGSIHSSYDAKDNGNGNAPPARPRLF